MFLLLLPVSLLQQQVQSTANSAIRLTEDVLKGKDELKYDFEEMHNGLGENLCPGEKPLARAIQKQIKEFYDLQVKAIDKEVTNQLKLIESDMRTLVDITEQVDSSLEAASGFFYATVSVSVVVSVMILMFLVITYFSHKGVSNCWTKLAT